MTQTSILLDDNLENVKASLLVAIQRLLTSTYPKEFGEYKTSKGDIISKVFWSDTVRYRSKFPYCMLTPQTDLHEGIDEVKYFRRADGKFVKRTISRAILNVSIDVCDMGDETIQKSQLEADTFAHKVARQLRKYFNGDEMLDWFSGNEYYPRQLGIKINSEINSTLNWSDTDTIFRYAFDISLGWNDVVDVEIDPAKGVHIDMYENNKKIDELYKEINK